MVASLELEDPPATGHCAGKTDREQRRVETRHGELQAVHVEPPAQVIREPARVDRFVSEDGAVRYAVAHRLREDRVAVPRDERAEGHVKVDVFVAVAIAQLLSP